MAQQTAARKWPQIERLLVGLAALLLLLMPANYRGGAPLTHPHALFQFWSSDGLHAEHHHHHEHNHEHQRQPPSTAPPPDTPVLTDMSATADPASVLILALATSFLIGIGRMVLVPASPWALSTVTLSPDLPPPQ